MAGLEEWSSPGPVPSGAGRGTEFGLSSLCGGTVFSRGCAPNPTRALRGDPEGPTPLPARRARARLGSALAGARCPAPLPRGRACAQLLQSGLRPEPHAGTSRGPRKPHSVPARRACARLGSALAGARCPAPLPRGRACAQLLQSGLRPEPHAGTSRGPRKPHSVPARRACARLGSDRGARMRMRFSTRTAPVF